MNSKALLLLFVVLQLAFPPADLHADAPPNYTAEWVRLEAPKLNGKVHVIRIARVDFARRGNGIAYFDALTCDTDGDHMSWIRIAVREDQATVVQSRYGSDSDWKSSGSRVLRNFEGVVVWLQADDYVMLVEKEIYESIKNAHEINSTQTAAEEGRTWTSSDGRMIQAKLVSATDKNVTIKRLPDGTVFTIDLSKLSEEDRDFVAKWRAQTR